MRKILTNISENPTNKKFSIINYSKIAKKFDKCYDCINLLNQLGFKKMNDRFILENAKEKLNKINDILIKMNQLEKKK